MTVKEFSDLYKTARCRYNKIKKCFILTRESTEETSNLLKLKRQAEVDFKDINDSDLYDKNFEAKCCKMSYLFWEAIRLESIINKSTTDNIECYKASTEKFKEKWLSLSMKGDENNEPK